MKRMIAFLFSLGVVAGICAAGGEPAAYGDDRPASILRQTSSTPLPSGALVPLAPTLQPQVTGNFGFVFANGLNTAVITPDSKYMYVLANTSQNNTNGSNKILTYRINSDGTVTATGNPQAGQNTNGTSLYLANQGTTLLAVDTDGSDPSAATAPFEVFLSHTDGSLSLVPNTVTSPDTTIVSGPAAMGPQAADGSGQYFYVALVDNNPNDGTYYLTSQQFQVLEIAANGILSEINVHNFIFPPTQPGAFILNVLSTGRFLYFFGDSGAYLSSIATIGVPGHSFEFTPYNDSNFFGDAFFGMQFSPSGPNFYAIDSPDGNIASLGICHYPINSDGTIQFASKSCETVFSNVPSGESFGANGLYISPDNEFLYGLFQTEVGPACSSSMYAYAINSDGSLSPLNFTSASPANSLPIGNNFCSDAFIAGAPDGSYVYAFGMEGQNNAIVPFGINKGLTSTGLTMTRLVAHVRGLGLPKEIEDSLMAEVLAAQQNLHAGHLGAACGSLGAFVNVVEAQNRNKFDPTQAAALIVQATAINQAVGCRRGAR